MTTKARKASRAERGKPKDLAPFFHAFRAYARELEPAVDKAIRSGSRPKEIANAFMDAADEATLRLRVRLARAYAASAQSGGARAISDVRVTKAKRSAADRVAEITVPIEERSVKWAERKAAQKIVEVSKEQRELVRGIVASAYERGEHPSTVADSLKMVVGLTARQADAVERRRAAVLERTEDPERADALADRYANQQLDYRADTIARTENKDAQERGREMAWQAAVDEGLLPEGTRKKWDAVMGDNTCEGCQALDGEEVALDELFDSEEYGELEGPPAHPSCWCTQTLVFD